MSSHERCQWNCGETYCTAPKRPPIEDGLAINLGRYAGSYGGTVPPKPTRRIDPWLAAAVAMYLGNMVGWAAWVLWNVAA